MTNWAKTVSRSNRSLLASTALAEMKPTHTPFDPEPKPLKVALGVVAGWSPMWGMAWLLSDNPQSQDKTAGRGVGR